MTHLRGGLQLTSCNTPQTSSNLWRFFRMYFIAHDIMSNTTFNGWHEDEALHLWSENDDLEEVCHPAQDYALQH